MNMYLVKCVSFLEKIGSENHLPERDELKIKTDGTSVRSINIADHISMGQVSVPNILELSLIFMVFDSYLESKDITLEGKTFRQKYNSLPKNDDLERIVSTIYRVLKTYRNATVHKMSSITANNTIVSIQYNFAGTCFKLEISQKGIAVMKDFILCYFHYIESSKVSKKYRYMLFSAYYNDIYKEISLFEDEDGDKSTLPIFSEVIDRYLRIDCYTINYSDDGNDLIFNIPDSFNDPSKNPIDVHFDYQGRDYLLPVEILGKTKKISIRNLSEWEIDLDLAKI